MPFRNIELGRESGSRSPTWWGPRIFPGGGGDRDPARTNTEIPLDAIHGLNMTVYPPHRTPQRVARAALATSPPLSAGFAFAGMCVTASNGFHKFKIGQKVSYRPYRGASPRACTVIALLPEREGEFEYQIRRQDFPSDQVVGESKLREPREH